MFEGTAGGREGRGSWQPVRAGAALLLTVSLQRANRFVNVPGSRRKVFAPRFGKPKDEGWFLLLGDRERRELLALRRVAPLQDFSPPPSRPQTAAAQVSTANAAITTPPSSASSIHSVAQSHTTSGSSAFTQAKPHSTSTYLERGPSKSGSYLQEQHQQQEKEQRESESESDSEQTSTSATVTCAAAGPSAAAGATRSTFPQPFHSANRSQSQSQSFQSYELCAQVPSRPGRLVLTLFLLSDSLLALDQQFDILLDVFE